MHFGLIKIRKTFNILWGLQVDDREHQARRLARLLATPSARIWATQPRPMAHRNRHAIRKRRRLSGSVMLHPITLKKGSGRG